MKNRFKNLLNKKGYTFITSIIGVLILIMCLVCFLAVTPVFVTKMSLDSYASELCREAEVEGKVGDATTNRLNRLNDVKGLYPTVEWTVNGSTVSGTSNTKIKLGKEVTVTVSKTVTMYFMGEWTINLVSTSSGVSEVYWK